MPLAIQQSLLMLPRGQISIDQPDCGVNIPTLDPKNNQTVLAKRLVQETRYMVHGVQCAWKFCQ